MNQLAPQAVILPESCLVHGPNAQCQNFDICGRYFHSGSHGGYPLYQNRKTGMVVRFWNGRWCMDRGGVRDSDVCTAYALQLPGGCHPADPALVWNVFEHGTGRFEEDRDLFAIDAPESLIFAGRGAGRSNGHLNGKYTLEQRLANNRALYKHQQQPFVIHYEEDRWVVVHEQDLGSGICAACAENIGCSNHPGDAALAWHFWEEERNSFVRDPDAGLVDAPEVVNVFGRHDQLENSRINGTYQLCGVNAGRPLYVEPASQAAIRYSLSLDRWLIDCDFFQKPGIVARLQQWVMSGDSDDIKNRCSAWAKANRTAHPGHISLEWNIFEPSCGRFNLDTTIVCTSCPLTVTIAGREGDNANINGEYSFVGQFQGKAAYRMTGSTSCLYWSVNSHRWVIDRHGMQDSNVCVAYAEGDECAEHPAKLSQWHVHDSSQGGFVPDPAVRTSSQLLPPPACLASEPLGIATSYANQVNSRGIKRGYGVEPEQMAYPEAQHIKFARTVDHRGGASRWRSIFGA
jgi:hypothetical protein